MAVSAMRLAFPKTSRSAKGFHDECGFAEPAIFVERAPRDFGIRAAQIDRRESRSCGWIIHFAVRARLSQRGLGMALAADRDIAACRDCAEIHYVAGARRHLLARAHGQNVLLSRTVAHFA